MAPRWTGASTRTDRPRAATRMRRHVRWRRWKARERENGHSIEKAHGDEYGPRTQASREESHAGMSGVRPMALQSTWSTKDVSMNADLQAARFDSATRPIIDGRTYGFCKLIVDRASRAILGCHIVGERAVDIVQSAAIAMAAGMQVDVLARLPLSFPTYTRRPRSRRRDGHATAQSGRHAKSLLGAALTEVVTTSDERPCRTSSPRASDASPTTSSSCPRPPSSNQAADEIPWSLVEKR